MAVTSVIVMLLLAAPARADDCGIEQRLDEVAVAAKKDLGAYFRERFRPSDRKAIAAWVLPGGASTEAFRRFAALEMVERFEHLKDVRTFEPKETARAMRRAKLDDRQTLEARDADLLGKKSRIDALVTLRLEGEGDGFLLKAVWRQTHRGEPLGRMKRSVCRDATLDKTLPRPVAVTPPAASAPAPLGPERPEPPTPPTPPPPAEPTEPTEAVAPPEPVPPSAPKPYVYRSDGFALTLTKCARSNNTAASVRCDFIVTPGEQDVRLLLAVNRGPRTRAYAEGGKVNRELAVVSGKLGRVSHTYHVHPPALPAGIKTPGAVTFKSLPDGVNRPCFGFPSMPPGLGFKSIFATSRWSRGRGDWTQTCP